MSDNINGIVIGSTFTEPATADDANYRFTLDVLKQISGGYQISYYRGSTLVASTTQGPTSGFATTMGTTPITGVAFRHSNTPGVLTYLDNVSVSQVIPEPSTGIVMLSAFVLLWAARGRLVTVDRE